MQPAVPIRRPKPQPPKDTSEVAATGVVRLSRYAMATRFELVLAGGGEAFLRAAGEAALDEIEDCEFRLSRFRRDSLVSHLCRHGHSRPLPLDPESYRLLQMCADVHRASGGAFDPTVAPLMRALGFDCVEGGPACPDVATARAKVGFDAVQLDPQRSTIRLLREGVGLDFGAIGKGHALDLAAAALAELGVRSALLHGSTSSVVALGSPPGLPAWRIAVGPFADGPVAHLRDGALSVSAPHGRTLDTGRGMSGHVLDPRTGQPSSGVSVTATLSGSAAEADAWSTALLVMAAADDTLDLPDSVCARIARTGPSGAGDWTALGRKSGASHFEDQLPLFTPHSTQS